MHSISRRSVTARHTDSEVITGGIRKVLFHSQISFSGLNRGMTQRDLDLFETRPAFVSQLGKGTAHVVRREGRADPVAVRFDDFVDRLGTHALPRDAVALVYTAEHQASRKISGGQPLVHGSLRPVR